MIFRFSIIIFVRSRSEEISPVVSNINISVPSLSTAQTPQRPRNFATSTTSTFKTATRTATIFCACHYWESTVSWILKFADNSSLVHFILEIWIYLKINVECDEDLVKRKGGINFGNIVPFEKWQHHFQSSENNFFIGGIWKINNSKHFLQEYIKVNEKNIARIANAVQVTICLLVSTSVY